MLVAAARRIPLHFFFEYAVAAARRIAVMQVQIESDEVLGWLQREGGMVGSVRIQNFDHGGETVRGLGATATIAKGKEVLYTHTYIKIHKHKHTHKPTHKHRCSTYRAASSSSPAATACLLSKFSFRFKFTKKCDMIILVRLLLFQLQNLQLIILYKDFFFRMDKQEVLLAAEVAHEFHQGSDGQYQRWLEALPSLEELEVFHPLFATNEDLTLFSDLRTGAYCSHARARTHTPYGTVLKLPEALCARTLSLSHNTNTHPTLIHTNTHTHTHIHTYTHTHQRSMRVRSGGFCATPGPNCERAGRIRMGSRGRAIMTGWISFISLCCRYRIYSLYIE